MKTTQCISKIFSEKNNQGFNLGRKKISKRSGGFTLINRGTIKLNPEGFTLIELLVVIAIISVLAAIGYAAYSTSQAAGRDAKRISDVEEIAKAMLVYKTTNNSFPSNASNSVKVVSDTTDFKNYFQTGNAPQDPKVGTDYGYNICTADTNKFLICARLENPKKGNTVTVDPCNWQTVVPATDSTLYFCASYSR
jgi:prepilin-type N-terminal cleavage/methylation domain-containing protein